MWLHLANTCQRAQPPDVRLPLGLPFQSSHELPRSMEAPVHIISSEWRHSLCTTQNVNVITYRNQNTISSQSSYRAHQGRKTLCFITNKPYAYEHTNHSPKKSCDNGTIIFPNLHSHHTWSCCEAAGPRDSKGDQAYCYRHDGVPPVSPFLRTRC